MQIYAQKKEELKRTGIEEEEKAGAEPLMVRQNGDNANG